MEFNDIFGQILCINLDRRIDRWEKCVSEFEKNSLQVERISAIEGVVIPGNKLNAGEVGCKASHIKVLAIAAMSNKPTLILEDDVEFEDEFKSKFMQVYEKIPTWDMLYLGGNHVLPPHAVNGKFGFSRVRKIYTTSSYIVTPSTAKRLLLFTQVRPFDQIDVAYAGVQGTMQCYAFTPPLAWQKIGFSDIQCGIVDYTKYMIK